MKLRWSVPLPKMQQMAQGRNCMLTSLIGLPSSMDINSHCEAEGMPTEPCLSMADIKLSWYSFSNKSLTLLNANCFMFDVSSWINPGNHTIEESIRSPRKKQCSAVFRVVLSAGVVGTVVPVPCFLQGTWHHITCCSGTHMGTCKYAPVPCLRCFPPKLKNIIQLYKNDGL